LEAMKPLFSSKVDMVMAAAIWDEVDADIITAGAEAVTVAGAKLGHFLAHSNDKWRKKS